MSKIENVIKFNEEYFNNGDYVLVTTKDIIDKNIFGTLKIEGSTDNVSVITYVDSDKIVIPKKDIEKIVKTTAAEYLCIVARDIRRANCRKPLSALKSIIEKIIMDDEVISSLLDNGENRCVFDSLKRRISNTVNRIIKYDLSYFNGCIHLTFNVIVHDDLLYVRNKNTLDVISDAIASKFYSCSQNVPSNCERHYSGRTISFRL